LDSERLLAFGYLQLAIGSFSGTFYYLMTFFLQTGRHFVTFSINSYLEFLGIKFKKL